MNFKALFHAEGLPMTQIHHRNIEDKRLNQKTCSRTTITGCQVILDGLACSSVGHDWVNVLEQDTRLGEILMSFDEGQSTLKIHAYYRRGKRPD